MIRAGVIGAGWWATELHLPELQADPRVVIAAVSRLGRPELERVQAAFGALSGYEDYREMLARESLDAVVIASPHTLHYEHARAALERGCNVLVEKPMTTSAEQARELVRLANQKGAVLMVAYGYNFAPMVARAAELVANGAIGDVRHVTLQMASSLQDLFSGQGLKEARNSMFQPEASTWASPANAGGYGWGQLTHALGILFHLVDLEPVEVFGTSQLSASGVDMNTAGVVRFANGAIAAISGTAVIPKHVRAQVDIRLFGTAGTLLLDMERERVELQLTDRAAVVVPVNPGDGDYPRRAPLRAFIDVCCGARQDNPAPGIVGQRATEVLDALYRSAASCKPEKCGAP